MHSSRAWPPVLLALWCWLTPAAAGAQARLPTGFDVDVRRALERFQVPGAAIVVLQDDRVLLLRGYGVRRLRGALPVSPHTLFQIGSNTKAFTAAGLALLVDSGRLDWDGRVTGYLPGFELSDPWVTRELTVRDLLTHRSGLGLGAGDLLWLHSTLSRREIVYRIRAARSASSFRSAYAYDNVLYAVAGEIVPAVTQMSWDAFVRARLLTPLGMTDTRTGIADLQPGDVLATPYGILNGQLQVVPLDTADNIGPAGALLSSAADLARWVQAQLDSGRVGATSLWSPAATRQMWAPQTIIPIEDPEPPLAALRPNFFAYGLGWRLQDYRGRKLVWHTGGLAGMTSRITLVPAERLGIAVLSNGESDLPNALTYELLDFFFHAPQTDWISAFADVADHDQKSADSVVATEQVRRDTAAPPPLPLSRYVGAYRDSLYGDATVTLEQGVLVFRLSRSPAFTGDLEPWEYDTFITDWRTPNLAAAFLTFDLSPEGTVVGIRMAAVSPLADFSFDYQDLHFLPLRVPSAR